MDYSGVFNYKGIALDKPAMFAFSVHKCGSTMLHTMVRQVCERAELPHMNVPAPLFNLGYGSAWAEDPDLLPYIKPGYVYFGFRELPAIFYDNIDFNASPSVLLVRDPRDALVSQYFSFRPGGSHVLPSKDPKRFLERQRNAGEVDIDAYVLQHANNLRSKLEAYLPIVRAGKLTVLRYERAFFKKAEFLQNVFSEFGIDVDPLLLEEVAMKNDVVPEKEDTSRHIRKGVPGDHIEKLSTETIERLNELLSSTMAQYGYSLS